MAGHKKFSTLLDTMSEERRSRSDARVKTLRREMLLSEIRKYTDTTQQDLADRLAIAQPSLSKMEGQDDMQISTLRRYIGSLGGTLELIVHLPDESSARLTQFD